MCPAHHHCLLALGQTASVGGNNGKIQPLLDVTFESPIFGEVQIRAAQYTIIASTSQCAHMCNSHVAGHAMCNLGKLTQTHHATTFLRVDTKGKLAMF